MPNPAHTSRLPASEEKLHQDCYLWFHNNFPHLRGLLCYNLNNSAHKIAGNHNRSKGLQPGRADFTFYTPSSGAIFIELKTADGSQSPAQKKWEQLVTQHNYPYHIARTLDQFKHIIHAHAL